jgi:hypothetical protein
MTVRAALTALAVALVLPATATAAPCRGLGDPRGDTMISTGSTSPPFPAPSLDIVKGTIDVGKATTTIRLYFADMANFAVEAPLGAQWDWEIKTDNDFVWIGAMQLTGYSGTTVHRGVPGQGTPETYAGPGPVVDIAKDTVAWTLPTAALAKSGLTKGKRVAPRIRTWRSFGAGREGETYQQGIAADIAWGEETTWGRIGC